MKKPSTTQSAESSDVNDMNKLPPIESANDGEILAPSDQQPSSEETIKSAKVNELVSMIIECESRRISLDILSKIFAKQNIEVAHRWQSLKTKAKICTDRELDKLQKNISNLLNNHILYDDKIVIIFDCFEQAELFELQAVLSNSLDHANNDLFEDSNYIFSYSKTINENINIFGFHIIREVYERKELTEKDLGEIASIELKEFDRIVGYRPVKIDCYDSIIIDTSKNLLILQLDLGSIIIANAYDKFTNNLIKCLNNILIKLNATACRIESRSAAINLYSCMKKFYNNAEGEVTKVSFTSSKNNHHETLKNNARDVRKADYHVKGKAAEELVGGKISPYRVSKRFSNTANNWPQVNVGVHYRYFAKPGSKILHDAHIFDISCYDDYVYIIDKILANR